METHDRDALRQFARVHHVHYEVEPEEVADGERRQLVGVQLRIFATHDGRKLGVPGCQACVELLRDLHSFASVLVGAGDASPRAEIVPAAPAVYESPEVPDTDEVALTVRVRCDSPENLRPGADEDRCLGQIRERLAELGVPRR